MKFKSNYTCMTALMVMMILWIVAIPQSFAVQSQKAVNDNPEKIFYGRWKTDSGSLYEYKDGSMICIAVHSERYEGWINQVAIKNFRLTDDGWYVDQAIRYHDTGRLSKWVTAKIQIINDSSFLKTVIGSTEAGPKRCKPQLWERVR